MTMGVKIHPTAVIDAGAEIGESVEVGPYAVIEGNVRIGARTRISAHVAIREWTEIGEGCILHPGVVLGGVPQDIKFAGGISCVRISDNCVLREYVTIHRSSREGGVTRVGQNCYLMAYVHLGHDVALGNDVIITSYTGLSGHVTVGDKAMLGGLVGVHQFVKIGTMAMLGGFSKVVKDIPPYVIAEGNPARVRGLNVVGMRRHGIGLEARNHLRAAYKLIFHSNLNTAQSLERIRSEVPLTPEVRELIEFVETSERGIYK